jgi:hypothetical protein
MRNIRYIGTKALETAFIADTGIAWTPNMVDTVLSDELAARMLKYTDVFQDAGNAKGATVSAPADLPGGGGASLTPEQTTALATVVAGTAAGIDATARSSAATAATAAANAATAASTANTTATNAATTAANAATAAANAVARGNHTGTQAISTVTGLQTALDAKADSTAVTAAIATLDAEKIDLAALTPIGADLVSSLDTDLVVVTRGGVPYTIPLGLLVARRAIARDLPVLKTARALSVFQSTNTAADTVAAYINHIDVTPAEFDFPAEGWDMDVEIAVEGGLQGATINDSVAVGTLAKTIRIYVGIPGGALATFVNVSQTNDFVQPAATRASTAMFKFYATPFSLGNVIETHSIGAVGWPGSGGGPFNKQASRDFRANGLRVLVAGLYGAAGAGHIIKVPRLSVLLKK